MSEWRFPMEQAFPASDEVGRFIVGLGFIVNEWHRTMELMPKDEPAESSENVRGIRLMLARQQAVPRPRFTGHFGEQADHATSAWLSRCSRAWMGVR